jgi:hypothetical protein
MKIGSWLILALTCAGFVVTPAKAITPDMWQMIWQERKPS